MKEILRTTNPVTLSHAQAILAEMGITAYQFDQHMSVLEGSVGVLPRRLMVAQADAFRALSELRAAGLVE